LAFALLLGAAGVPVKRAMFILFYCLFIFDAARVASAAAFIQRQQPKARRTQQHMHSLRDTA